MSGVRSALVSHIYVMFYPFPALYYKWTRESPSRQVEHNKCMMEYHFVTEGTSWRNLLRELSFSAALNPAAQLIEKMRQRSA